MRYVNTSSNKCLRPLLNEKSKVPKSSYNKSCNTSKVTKGNSRKAICPYAYDKEVKFDIKIYFSVTTKQFH